MSTREISRKRARSDDDGCINKELTQPKMLLIQKMIMLIMINSNERTKNVFDELLNKGQSTDLLNIQDKNKGGSKVRSWIYLWDINGPDALYIIIILE